MQDRCHKLLMEFTHGTTPCRKHLVRRYGNELVDEALEKGYIVQIGVTDIGDPRYAITELGKKIRDN